MSEEQLSEALELHEQALAPQEEFRLDEAAALARRSADLLLEHEGEDTPDAANVLTVLASIDLQRFRLEEAFAAAARASAIMESLADQIDGGDPARILLEAVHLMGSVRREQGRYRDAEPLLRRSLALAEQYFGPASDEAATQLNSLAILCKYTAQFEEGEALYHRALEIVESVHGPESAESATIHHNLGGLTHSRGDFAAGETPARRAWEIRAKLLGADHPQAVADAYAGVLDGLGRYSESEPIYPQALDVFEKVYGPVHFEVAATLHNLAAVQEAKGDRAEAERLYRRALSIKQELLGPQSPDTALTAQNLARLLTEQGRSEEARAILAGALAALRAEFPPEHPQRRAAESLFLEVQ